MPTQNAQRTARVASLHPERAAHSARRFAGVQVQVIGTLQVAQAVVVAAEHEGRRCEQLEVLRSQRSRLIGARQRLVGVHPRAPCVGFAASSELVDDIHHFYSNRSGGEPRPAGVMLFAAQVLHDVSRGFPVPRSQL